MDPFSLKEQEEVFYADSFRILILDTDPEHLALTEKKFSRFPDLVVRGLRDPEAFLEILGEEDFDLVLIDLDRPEKEAVRLIRDFRQIRTDLEFLVFTSRPSYEQVMVALKEGALDFFPKPLDDLAVTRIVQNHRYRISESRTASRIDRYITMKKVRMVLPTDINILPQVANRITEEVFTTGVILPKQTYNFNLAIFESLTNALEHGNLGITYDEKTAHIIRGDYLEIVNEMCTQEPYRNRKIHVEYTVNGAGVRLHVEDEGRGFNVKSFLKKMKDRVNEDYHGRGIILIMKTMDRVTFNTRGNRITIQLKRQ